MEAIKCEKVYRILCKVTINHLNKNCRGIEKYVDSEYTKTDDEFYGKENESSRRNFILQYLINIMDISPFRLIEDINRMSSKNEYMHDLFAEYL